MGIQFDKDAILTGNTFCSLFSREGGNRFFVATDLTTSTYGTANRAYYVQVQVFSTITIANVGVWNDSVANGNFDIGIYNSAFSRLASTGSTAQSGTTVIQKVALAYTMNPGIYYIGFAADGVVGTYYGYNGASYHLSWSGVFQQATAFPLPATATPATLTTSGIFIPNVILTSYSVI